MRIPALLFLAALAAGCVHKIDVEQGNYVTQDVVDKLKPGMTRAQVKALLGTPLLADVFHGERWDYYFNNAPGGKTVAHKHLVVFFQGDKVVRWSGDANPPPPPPVRGEAQPSPAQAEPAAKTEPAAKPNAEPPAK
ncbi:MAG TPA: outer membrane protein assembly factor BamE [Usitatibacter sp.]|nr:outer membrane protein assembly factor BamE [Usitatibacter sp.]